MMRAQFSLVAVCLVLGLCTISCTAGTVEVANADDIIKLFVVGSASVVKDDIVLTADIDFSVSQEKLLFPLGNHNTSDCIVFSGTLDGRGHAFKNVVIDTSSEYNNFRDAGLFCKLEGATLKSLVLDKSCNLIGETVGALAPTTSGKVVFWNVTSHATIIGSRFCGGLVGNVESLEIEDCVSDVNITGSCIYVGGFVGNTNNGDDVNVTFHESTSTASVSSGYSNVKVGGFIGTTILTSNELLSIVQSTSHCLLSDNGKFAGGFIGQASCSGSSRLVIENSTNSGDITSLSSSSYIGGFVSYFYVSGYANVSIRNSLNTGSMKAMSSSINLGGFVGYFSTDSNSATIVLESNINHGEVFGNASHCIIGGFVGWFAASSGGSLIASNNTNNGPVRGNSYNNVGGFVGSMSVGFRAAFLKNTNHGNITCLEPSCDVGGLVGSVSLLQSPCVDFNNNTVDGPVSGFGQYNDVGGFIGSASQSTTKTTTLGFVGCASNSPVSCFAQRCSTGGVIGKLRTGSSSESDMTMNMRNTLNSANVLCDGPICSAGGFVGQVYTYDGNLTVSIKSCTNNGNVTASNIRSYSSGFVGRFYRSRTTSVFNATFESNTNNGNIIAIRDDSVASGFIGISFNSDTNVSSAVLNSVNNGFVNGKSAFGITKSLSRAHNVVNTRFVVGSTFAKLLWNSVDDASSVYSLNDTKRNESGIYFTKDGMRVDDMLNNEAMTNGYEMAWTSALSLAESVVQVSANGVIEERWTVGVGTVLGDIEILSRVFDSGEHTIVDADNKNALARNTVVT